MKEPTIVLILVLAFFILGGGIAYFSIMHSDFNFYKAEINADGKTVTENLYFQPDRDYHTLYRNFFSKATASESNEKNSIKIEDVQCEKGEAYFREISSCTIFSNKIGKTSSCPDYTENNEYGCSFGAQLGFQRGMNYWIKSDYILNPENLFKINGKNYIKFVAYSSERHAFLDNNNFNVNSEIVRKDYYFPREQVILYLPYTGSEEGFNIISKENFEFDNSGFNIFLLSIFVLFPPMIIFFGWFFFGRKKNYLSVPSELAEYPLERKGWEVGSFFNAPFMGMGANFFSTMLVSFYHKKIISIEVRNKEVWIKINETKEKLDKIESKFLTFLKELYKLSDEKYIDGSYLCLKKALQSYKVSFYATSFFSDLNKEIKKEGEKYLDIKGVVFVLLLSFIGFFFIFISPFTILISLFLIISLIIITSGSALFIKFKGDYYKEYLQWKAFKRYLSHSFTISQGDHRAVAIWDNYLIYATALGVSKKVLKELRNAHIIDDKHFAIYSGIYASSPSFASSTGTSSGGFGGAGGGGVGGGGGGGR